MTRPHFANRKTPLIAALALVTAALIGCENSQGPSALGAQACEQVTTPISSVQGDSNRTPVAGQSLTVRGVVTMRDGSDGVFLQSVTGDGNPSTSEGLYLDGKEMAAGLAVGDLVTAAGTVAELGGGKETLTSLTSISAYQKCDTHQALPADVFELPLKGADRESLEAMNLEWKEPLLLTGTYTMARGEVRLSHQAVLPNPTEIARPGPDARRQLALNRQASIYASLNDDFRQALPAGTSLLSGSGVLGHDDRGLRLLLRDDLNTLEPRQYRNSAADEGDIRVVSLNLHNYFNGNGRGGGFPTSRGAESLSEYEQQRSRLSATIAEVKPHIVAVMELENDGFGPASAAADFIADLEKATGSEWLVVFPGNPNDPDQGIGSDHITVGLFYEEVSIDLKGRARTLDSEPFRERSRQPLAQAFVDRRSGKSFTVVVNHLKSKGSCPDSGRNSDLRDGQGCWNEARTQAAKEVARWAMQLAEAGSEGRALVVGDMNAYRMEDPIKALLDAGFSDLTAPSGPRPSYSFFYAGEAGTLDYAFSSPELMPYVAAARVLHINSPWPPGMKLPQPWLRSSDHDPVIVDLGFNKD